MTREEVLSELIELIDPIDEITEQTVISDSDDIDSLALFNIVVYLKKQGKNYSLADLAKCKKVGNFVELALN